MNPFVHIFYVIIYVYSFYQFLAIDIQLYSAGVGDSKQKIFNPSARHCGGWARGAGQLAAAADVHHFFRPARSEEWTARWILPRQGARGFGGKHAMFSESQFWEPMVTEEFFCYIMFRSCYIQYFCSGIAMVYKMVEDGNVPKKPPVVEFGMGLKVDHILRERKKHLRIRASTSKEV